MIIEIPEALTQTDRCHRPFQRTLIPLMAPTLLFLFFSCSPLDIVGQITG
jgi:hypothetical protein